MRLPQRLLLLTAAAGVTASCREVTGGFVDDLRWAAAAGAPSLVVSADRDRAFNSAIPASLPGSLSSTGARTEAIVEAQRWSLLLDDLEARLPPPATARFAVDWEREMVLFAQAERALSLGHTLAVTHVAEVRDTVFALVERERPGWGCAPMEVAIQPTNARLVQRRESPVVFLEREYATNCISGKRERLR